MRDHEPVTINKFNGLYSRGDVSNVPLDHFTGCNNLKFIGDSSFSSRDGIGVSQNVAVPLSNVKRIYNYPTNSGQTKIVLCQVSATDYSIYHVVSDILTYGPILTLANMQDFAFASYGGRAYISPCAPEADFQMRGLLNANLYVYAGDGTNARLAAGAAMTGALAVANGAAGHTDPGLHLFGWVRESISGYLAPPGQLTPFTTVATNSVSFGTVQATGDPTVAKRHLVATRVITLPFDGDLVNQTYYFVPGAVINDDTTLFLNNVSFYDADLLEDASHLLNNYTAIPAGAVLSIYRNRLILSAYNVANNDDGKTTVLVSEIGEPEAISQIDGLLAVPPDGNPVTNAQEVRDVLYVTKRSRTVSFVDTGSSPATWPMVIIDPSLGTGIHGVAAVLDGGGSNIDYLFIATYQGISLFNGKYVTPELTWKIQQYWLSLERIDWRFVQMINCPIQKQLWVVLPNRTILVGDYSNGLDYKKIQWSPWSAQMAVNTLCVTGIDEIIIGADIF